MCNASVIKDLRGSWLTGRNPLHYLRLVASSFSRFFIIPQTLHGYHEIFFSVKLYINSLAANSGQPENSARKTANITHKNCRKTKSFTQKYFWRESSGNINDSIYLYFPCLVPFMFGSEWDNDPKEWTMIRKSGQLHGVLRCEWHLQLLNEKRNN